jgi:glycosyltransferase involved in cell wall biosynthesis
VAVETFYWKEPEDYYLIVSELVAYKRIDTAVRLFSKTGRRLRIAGQGPEYGALRRMAAKNVEFCGRVSDKELRELFARCRAFLMPGEEDFGLTCVEALASGKPVVALRRGGAVESVPTLEPAAGVFYESPDEDLLAAAIQQLERIEPHISHAALQGSVERFCEKRFAQEMSEVLSTAAGYSVAPAR